MKKFKFEVNFNIKGDISPDQFKKDIMRRIDDFSLYNEENDEEVIIEVSNYWNSAKVTEILPLKVSQPKIRLTMLSTKHEGQENFFKEGYTKEKYEVGEPFIIFNKEKDRIYCTTKIVEIIDNYTFSTANTTYKIEPI